MLIIRRPDPPQFIQYADSVYELHICGTSAVYREIEESDLPTGATIYHYPEEITIEPVLKEILA